MRGHLPHLLVQGVWDDETLAVTGEQQHHLEKVLRLMPGEALSYTDGVGTVGTGVYTSGRIVRGHEATVPRANNLTLAVAPPTSRDRCRFLVEKLSELGVAHLVWLSTRHGEGRVPGAGKAESWAAAALEQSRGGWLIQISTGLVGWEELERPLVVAVPGGGEEVLEVRTVGIGPEGGLDPDDIPEDAASIDLGPTILRVETAAVVAASRFRRSWSGT